MPFCTSCGSPMDDAELYCAKCGEPVLLPGSSVNNTVTMGLEIQGEGRTAAVKGDGRQTIILAALILVLGLGGYAIYNWVWPAFNGTGAETSTRDGSTASSSSAANTQAPGQDTASPSNDSGSLKKGQEAVSSGDKPGYRKYTNYTFGYSIDYPYDYTMSGSINDGRIFTSSDGRSEIEVYARAITGGITIQSSYAEAMNSIPGSQSNYHVLSEADQWFVVTGVDSSNRNLYRKTYIGNGFEKSFVITRPVNAANPDYDQVMEDVEDSYEPHL